MNTFFRKDLNLNEKWWHRFVKIVFYGILIIIIFFGSNFKLDGTLCHKEADLWERIKDRENKNPSKDLLTLWSLKGILEVIGTDYDCEGNYWRLLRMDKYEENLDNIYCSSNRTNEKLERLMEKTWYLFYDNSVEKNQEYIRDYLNNRNNNQRQLRRYLDTKNIYSDTNTVREFINKNNILCITTDNIVNTDFYYLEYTRFSLADGNICFMRDDGTSRRVDLWIKLLIWLIYAFVIWVIWIVFYYKIFIYIVYWKSKKN